MKTLLALVVLFAVATWQIEGRHHHKPYHGFHCKHAGHFEDPNDCYAFIQCDDFGNAFHHYCPDGTIFNPYIGVCDHTYNYECGSYQSDARKRGHGRKRNPCKHRHGALLPYKKDCHYYIHCSHGVGYVQPCPADLVWNNIKKTCDWYNKHHSYKHCHYHGHHYKPYGKK